MDRRSGTKEPEVDDENNPRSVREIGVKGSTFGFQSSGSTGATVEKDEARMGWTILKTEEDRIAYLGIGHQRTISCIYVCEYATAKIKEGKTKVPDTASR